MATDGKELFYLASDGKMVPVSVNAVDSTLETAAPKMLFHTRLVDKLQDKADRSP